MASAESTGPRDTDDDLLRRQRKGRAGFRPIQFWVPDVRSEKFLREAHRQAHAVATSPSERDDQAFVEGISDSHR